MLSFEYGCYAGIQYTLSLKVGVHSLERIVNSEAMEYS